MKVTTTLGQSAASTARITSRPNWQQLLGYYVAVETEGGSGYK